jgi:DNA-binding transcriptional regulator YdaS (Cro superfamily)
VDQEHLTPFEAFDLAVTRAGGQSALARICGCTPANISQLLSAKRELPGEYVLAVERATNVALTKIRQPLTFENALTKVAGHIGWARVAEITKKAENTVRNWSDQDTTASITLDAALLLDEEFHKTGGDGTPFLHTYAVRMEAFKIAASPSLRR